VNKLSKDNIFDGIIFQLIQLFFVNKKMPLERSLIDKAINGALLGKRKIGRPLRYNLRTKGKNG